MSGEYDYLLKVIVADTHALDVFYKKLVSGIGLSYVTSRIAMELVKYTTLIPVKSLGYYAIH